MTQQAMAMPSAYVSQHGSLFIENFTNSTLLRDTEKSQTVWVLPPSTGETVLKNFMPSANLGFCAGLKDLHKASNMASQRIKEIAEQLGQKDEERTDKAQALSEAKLALAELGKKPELQAKADMEDQIVDLQSRQDALILQLEECNLDTCALIQEQYQDVRDELRGLKTDLKALKKEHRELSRENEKLRAVVEVRQAEYDDLEAKYLKYLSQMEEIRSTIRRIYAEDAKLEGGYAGIDYELGWSRNVQELEKRYPEYDFKQIPTQDVRIFANFIATSSEDSYLEQLPSVLGFAINGIPFLPWGQTSAVQAALPDAIVGDIRLSLIGACPLHLKDFFDDSTGSIKTTGSGEPLFGLSVQYSYPGAYKYNVTASYNLWSIYERINKSSKSGGFFSSKSRSEIIENTWSGDSFKIKWEEEDPNGSLTAEKRQEIEAHLKSELMNRVLSTMAEPVPGQPGYEMPIVGTAPTPGALVLANGLTATCGFNFYCKAGGWLLKGATSIWGTSKTEASFKTSSNKTATESWSSVKATLIPAQSTFRR
jgi:regulator of replication initiation timing